MWVYEELAASLRLSGGREALLRVAAAVALVAADGDAGTLAGASRTATAAVDRSFGLDRFGGRLENSHDLFPLLGWMVSWLDFPKNTYVLT